MRTSPLLSVAMAGAVLLSFGPRAFTQVPGAEWDEMTKALRAIQSATTADEAAAAYARGCTQNRQSVKLQDAYLRKTLKLGRPDRAWRPAKELTTLAPKNGMAWGVLGYKQAKDERYIAAIGPALRAAEFEPENTSICQNAAQLLVWYEGGKRLAVDADTSGRMKRLKSPATSGKVFAKAYKAAKSAYTKLGRDVTAKKKEADAASKEADALEQKYEKLRKDLQAKGKKYDAERKKIYSAKRSIARTEDSMRRSTNYNSRIAAERSRERAYRQLREAERDARNSLRDGKKIKENLKDAEKAYKNKKEHAARLRREAAKVTDGVPSTFGWLPPAVDGVVTPDATVAGARPRPAAKGTAPPAASYLAPTQAKTATTPAAASVSEQLAEAEASAKLDLAKICLASKDGAMQAAGKKHLAAILSQYPNTKAAAEAKALADKNP